MIRPSQLPDPYAPATGPEPSGSPLPTGRC